VEVEADCNWDCGWKCGERGLDVAAKKSGRVDVQQRSLGAEAGLREREVRCRCCVVGVPVLLLEGLRMR